MNKFAYQIVDAESGKIHGFETKRSEARRVMNTLKNSRRNPIPAAHIVQYAMPVSVR